MRYQFLEKVAKLYSDNLNKYGPVATSVGWRDEASQKLRFCKLVEVIEGEALRQPLIINELGCGYGSMYEYLENDCSLHVAQYYGYDISEEMLDCARQTFKNKNATFIKSDHITREADYSFTSGIFNVKFDIPEDLWQQYIEETLSGMDAKSTRGFTFNVLSTYVDYREKHLYYADPSYYFDFCKKNFSKKVSLLHDYNLWEWTIVVKKV